MKIEFVLFASFKDCMPEHAGGKPCVMEIEQGTTVGILIKHLHLPENRPKMIFVNGLRAKGDTLLSEGDRAGIFPLIAGG